MQCRALTTVVAGGSRVQNRAGGYDSGRLRGVETRTVAALGRGEDGGGGGGLTIVGGAVRTMGVRGP